MRKCIIWWAITMAFLLGMYIGSITAGRKIFRHEDKPEEVVIEHTEEEEEITKEEEIEEKIEEIEEEIEEVVKNITDEVSPFKKKLIDIIKGYAPNYIKNSIMNRIEEEAVITPLESAKSETWLPYLATSYCGANETGNKGELLQGRKAVAMWQSDEDYLKNSKLHPMYREFFETHDGKDYGALPYGSKIEIRVWNQETSSYINLGVYEVLDDSPTTQYNISDTAKKLNGEDGELYFKYNWADIDYLGNKTRGGEKLGYIPNWKEEYSNKICGWIDVRDAYWGFVVIEVRMVK